MALQEDEDDKDRRGEQYRPCHDAAPGNLGETDQRSERDWCRHHAGPRIDQQRPEIVVPGMEKEDDGQCSHGRSGQRQRNAQYPLNVPVQQAGAYQLRFAVRDAATERIGSASEFVEVPEVDKGKRLAVSGLVAAGYEPPPPAAAQGTEAYEPNPELSPAVRRFRRGTRMDFGYIIYNARTDSSTGKPKLTTQVRLFRDGKQVFASDPEAFDPAAQVDLKRLTASGRLRLGGDLTPGEYLLQVIVTDALAPEREQTVTQWTDFEIIG